MKHRSFEDFVVLKEQDPQQGQKKDWKKEFIQLEKGFIPPDKLRPVIEAFLKSGEVSLMKDTSKGDITMDKKPLFLVGGPVRDFLAGKSIKDYDLASSATPEQMAHILHNAGFKMSPERTGKEGAKLNLTFEPREAESGDKKVWYVKGRDETGKPFVIGAVVNGEEFDLATFRRDAKVTDGAATVDFVDSPHEDASRRDLTINAMYIELTKPDGENSKLYDPTGKGWHDAKHGNVRTVGNAADRFNEDKLRVMRAIRFHCRFGSGSKMDDDIEKAIPRFKNLKGVALERVRDEFLKGLLHPDIDSKCYLGIFGRTGLMNKVFPGVEIHADIPKPFRDKRDKPLALAWILQNNPVDKVEAVLSSKRDETPTGWSTQEKRAIVYLLKLKEFSPENVDDFISQKAGTGLSEDQIKDWVDYFRYTDTQGRDRDRRPQWAAQMRAFSDFSPDTKNSVSWHEKVPDETSETGFSKGGVHPDIIAANMHNVPPHMRSTVVKQLNKQKLANSFKDLLPKNQ